MKDYYGNLNQPQLYSLSHWYNPEDVLLFDIETTGFSPRSTILYMIGYCFYSEQSWHYRMLFNDDGHSEVQLLEEFLTVMQNYSVLLHYNGDGFDLPYLSAKYNDLAVTDTEQNPQTVFNTKTSVDLYKIIQPFRKELGLANLKLTTIEKAMGISRTDTYNGGELIKVYADYLHTRNPQLEQLLFRHNYEDILAMIPMLQLLHFRGLKEHAWTITELATDTDTIRLQLRFTYPLPLRFTGSNSYLDFNGFQEYAQIIIPLYHEEMKYFLPDWKNYYYLPLEDTVIHKSVAAYVDSSCKEKAQKKNCFLRKNADFFPCPKSLNTDIDKYYKRELTDTMQYAELKEELLTDTEFWTHYLEQAF